MKAKAPGRPPGKQEQHQEHQDDTQSDPGIQAQPKTKKAYKRTCPKCGATEREYVRRIKVFCGRCWDTYGEDNAPAMVYEFVRQVVLPNDRKR